MKKNKAADKVFRDFSYSHRKEYIEWITEAKTEATRDKRIAQAVEWIAEGKAETGNTNSTLPDIKSRSIMRRLFT